MRWLTLPRSCDPVTLLPSLQLGLDSTLLPHHITHGTQESNQTTTVRVTAHIQQMCSVTTIHILLITMPRSRQLHSLSLPHLSSRLGTDSQHNERVELVAKNETSGSVSLRITDVHRILEVGELYHAWYSRTPTRNQLIDIMHNRRDELLSHILRLLRLERTGERILTGQLLHSCYPQEWR